MNLGKHNRYAVNKQLSHNLTLSSYHPSDEFRHDMSDCIQSNTSRDISSGIRRMKYKLQDVSQLRLHIRL